MQCSSTKYRVQPALHPGSVRKTCLFRSPGQLRGNIHKGAKCVVKAKDFNAGWQLRGAAPLEKAPVGTAVIVGAGVAGLVSALGLAKFGMQVHVFDKDDIHEDKDTAVSRIELSNQSLLALRSVGCNVTGEAFSSTVLSSSEVRGMDSNEGMPHTAMLPEPQMFSTYSNLKRFIRDEIERLAAGRVEYHSQCTLEEVEKVDVANKTITFATTGGADLTQKYDVLVGAEGAVSITRKVLVKNDKTMKSQLSYIGPMRYVSARGLSAQDDTSSDQFKLLTNPSDTSQSQPAAASGGLQANVKPATLASPVEIAGHPTPEWGLTQQFRIHILAFEDPVQPGKYCASLQGTPEFFGELAEVLETGGKKAVREALQVLFHNHLPQAWLDGLAAAVQADPSGYSAGANVLTSRVSTANAPAIVIVGDAACATTWRLGFSLETAIDGAIALSDSFFKCSNLGEALESLNDTEKIAESNALARIDRVAPAFTGEQVPMGPLKVVITAALLLRQFLHILMLNAGFPQFAPHVTYARALRRGMPANEVYKKILRETAVVTAIFLSLLASFVRVALDMYAKNRYVFA